MITIRTIALALLAWRAVKITESAVGDAKQCQDFASDLVNAGGVVDWTAVIPRIAENTYCRNTVFDAIKALGVSLGTVASAQRNELVLLVAAFLAFRMNNDSSLSVSQLPDIAVGIFSLFGMPERAHVRRRGTDGRYTRGEL